MRDRGAESTLAAFRLPVTFSRNPQDGVYAEWLDGLRDADARARVLIRVEHLIAGNPGDVRPAGEGLSELRIDYGPGYPVYFKAQGRTIVVCRQAGTSEPRVVT